MASDVYRVGRQLSRAVSCCSYLPQLINTSRKTQPSSIAFLYFFAGFFLLGLNIVECAHIRSEQVFLYGFEDDFPLLSVFPFCSRLCVCRLSFRADGLFFFLHLCCSSYSSILQKPTRKNHVGVSLCSVHNKPHSRFVHQNPLAYI